MGFDNYQDVVLRASAASSGRESAPSLARLEGSRHPAASPIWLTWAPASLLWEEPLAFRCQG